MYFQIPQWAEKQNCELSRAGRTEIVSPSAGTGEIPTITLHDSVSLINSVVQNYGK